MSLLLLLVVVLLVFGGGGGYYWGTPGWDPRYGGGIGLGGVLIVLVLLYLLGVLPHGGHPR